MPLGIVSDADFEKELGNSNSPIPSMRPPAPRIVLPTPVEPNRAESNHGRNRGDNNVPDSLRKMIGETNAIDGRSEAIDLAERFGISKSSVSAYGNGSTSTNSMNDQPNLGHINDARLRVSNKARKTLMAALGEITEDKLKDSKAVELASIARGMSAIVKEMEPELPKDNGEKDKPQFIVYSPTVHNEIHYESIHVRE